MSESLEHKRAKQKAAGKTGDVEVPMSGNRRLDAVNKNKAIEIQVTFSKEGIKKSEQRLLDSGKKEKILQVHEKYVVKTKGMVDPSIKVTAIK